MSDRDYLVSLIVRLMDRVPKFAGTPRDIIELLFDDFGVRLDGPAYPWALRYEIAAVAPTLARRGIRAVDGFALPVKFIRLTRIDDAPSY